MIDGSRMNRRGLFKWAGGVAATVALADSRTAMAQSAGAPRRLPAARGEFIIRNGHVLTMEPDLGDFPSGDVHVRDGTVVAVGPNLSAPNVERIDGRNMVVMPGFVETHWHMWNTFLRGVIRGDDPKEGYFPQTLRMGPYCTPEDAYRSVRFSVAEGLLSGITTVHDWSHNTRTPAHADAELQALRDTGIRARFSYGTGQELAPSAAMNLEDVARVQRQWAANDAMLSLGVALRTPGSGPRGTFPMEVLQSEMAALRKLGVPMTMHAGPKGLIQRLAENRLLGSDLLMVHPQGMTAEERQSIADTKTPFSTSPVIEMSYSAARNGYIQFAELEQLGVQLGLSLDSSGASANADFFNVMRALLWSNWQRTDTKLRLLPKRIVELATIEGARLLGLSDKAGSLKPGKRADIILVRTSDINMAPAGDPYYSLVFSGQPANVDTVMVDGRILYRHGKLTAIDLKKTIAEAASAAQALQARMPK
jgi:5-methylthioadenosine/S-adenosylhomocysteine deaminase